MNHFFTDYILFKEDHRKSNKLIPVAWYGNYELFENMKIKPNKLVNLRLNDITLFKTKDGKIRLPNPFIHEFFSLAKIENLKDEILVVINFEKRTVELFVNDNAKNSGAFIFELTTPSELKTEMNLMRQRAFSLS